ncbi:protein POLLEN DEFECTIVE IN GUIDANCE 1 [Selaginella moellendorffii]|uniref:protein POLLEN DEFECTIVE IN GUIDANCE 1 n=1 Tax=Selaginella moellendorffii TaxID=88036 RepID=UPI000D1C2DCF|nr:protein POLLEN DEFECTIVE IN GUIDANCE 1 [Selaginella moellendorffii]|eukprot:XP_024524348.1 protein POLLEN DEFECTIVE IN GUIDANCE 1 [Selaginella moellendorffii]
MAPAALVKRSVSFDLLSRDVAGDEDDRVAPPRNELVAEKNSRRRRRRSKKGTLKQSFSLSPGSSADLAGFADLVAQVRKEVPKFPTAVNGIIQQNGAEEKRAVHAVQENGDGPVLQENGTSSLVAHPSPQAVSNADTKVFDRFEAEKPAKQVDIGESWQARGFFHGLLEGSSLEATVRAGNQKSQDCVYNTLVHVPWRCELLILVGFFACLDSFLSLLVATPVRVVIALWRRLRERRALQARDLSDFGCLLVLVLGVLFLQQADISYIYHSIRFEPNIKLYVIYNMLEVFDKLFQSFGVDVLQVLYFSAMNYVSNAAGLQTFALNWLIAVGCFTVHSFIILFEAISLSAALHYAATNRSLLVLLMSNNFAEIKSTVFKRFNKQNMHDLAHTDTVERFHLLTCLFFAFAQNIILVEGPWMQLFFYHAAMVMFCESFVDLIKHSFLAKVNQVMPAAYTEFLEMLCEQIASSRKDSSRSKALRFIPLGPACVVIKVILPLYASYISTKSAWSSLLRFGLVAGGTFAILVALKIVVRWSLNKYAAWYLKRCHME